MGKKWTWMGLFCFFKVVLSAFAFFTSVKIHPGEVIWTPTCLLWKRKKTWCCYFLTSLTCSDNRFLLPVIFSHPTYQIGTYVGFVPTWEKNWLHITRTLELETNISLFWGAVSAVTCSVTLGLWVMFICSWWDGLLQLHLYVWVLLPINHQHLFAPWVTQKSLQDQTNLIFH